MGCEQADTHAVSTYEIVSSSEFARGLDEVRAGLPFNADNDDWDYERGRCFGFIAPLDMPLRIGSRLNPKALKLADAAFSRNLLI
jgi:hypothetical protein